MTRRLALGPGPAPAPASAGGAVLVGQVELSAGVDDIAAPARPGPPYAAVRLLVRLHGQPLGFVTLPLVDGRLAASAIAEQVSERLHSEANAHLVEDGLEPVASITAAGVGAVHDPRCRRRPAGGPGGPLVTVVVATRDRHSASTAASQRWPRSPTHRSRCWSSTTPRRPGDARARPAAVWRGRARPYVRELRPGLSYARNRGLGEALGELVAFTDDDVVVDPGWLDGVVRGFARSLGRLRHRPGPLGPPRQRRAALLRPARLLGRELHATPLRPARRPPGLTPVPLCRRGSGPAPTSPSGRRCCAPWAGSTRRSAARAAPAGGGEDLDVFVRTILAGHTIAYEPAAIVWHEHRDELGQLRRQLFNYGVGLAAFATKYLSDRRTARDILVRLPGGSATCAASPSGWSVPLSCPELS